MKLHEYQAKELLRKRGVKLLDSQVCFTLSEARAAIRNIGFPCVIKAQVHAGGRGKAGGIKVAQDEATALKYAEEILALTIKTAQTGEKGLKVSSVLIEKGAVIKQELYIGFAVDRERSQICLMASLFGGMDIEDAAHKDPDAIKKIFIEKRIGLMPYQVRDLADELKIDPQVKRQLVPLVLNAYRTFVETDASMLEINPLAIVDGHEVVALDARMTIDENALYRQRPIGEMRDPTQEDQKEIEASRHGLSYVALDGSIGCMVNGAGLAMATMDVIKFVGGSPANFLDVGGSATKERVQEALSIIVHDQNVKAIFVNVFGGIAKCDVIAEGIVAAAQTLKLKVPLVVRLEGTNVALGKSILERSGLTIIPASDMLDGAKKAVACAK